MTDTAVGLLGIARLFGLMILRTPVGIAMLITGFVGIYVLDGARTANAVMVTETYSSVANYSLTVVPLFVLLGNLASRAGFSRSLYEAAFAWIGPFRGGLASASVVGCAAFAAVSGSSVATAVTIGRVALPEMKRLGYGDALSTGAIAAGGTLGFLIPPSTGFAIYAILTEESIGRLFMAGILPGLLLTLLFVAAIWITVLRDPDAGPPGALVPMAERLRAFLQAAPLLSVIVVSIGGIYLGVFTPVEAAGVGAAQVIALAVFSGRMGVKDFYETLIETVRTSAMLYLIVLGYLVLGMFMDGLSMLVVTLPIVFPVIINAGFDPVWFGVIAVIVVEMGMITPPVGLNVFVVKSVAEDVPMSTIFRGVLPFWIAMMVCLVLIVAVPDIALLIPNSMFN